MVSMEWLRATMQHAATPSTRRAAEQCVFVGGIHGVHCRTRNRKGSLAITGGRCFASTGCLWSGRHRYERPVATRIGQVARSSSSVVSHRTPVGARSVASPPLSGHTSATVDRRCRWPRVARARAPPRGGCAARTRAAPCPCICTCFVDSVTFAFTAPRLRARCPCICTCFGDSVTFAFTSPRLRPRCPCICTGSAPRALRAPRGHRRATMPPPGAHPPMGRRMFDPEPVRARRRRAGTGNVAADDAAHNPSSVAAATALGRAGGSSGGVGGR
jgi:hypothetical protein